MQIEIWVDSFKAIAQMLYPYILIGNEQPKMRCKINSKLTSSTNSTMTIKEQLIQEVETFPDALLAEALDIMLFLKTRYIDTEITTEEQEAIAASQSAELGDYLTLEQYISNQA